MVVPTGIITMLFTDIEGSTLLLQRLGTDAYAELLGDHHRVMRGAVAACAGVEVKTEGDSFFVVFAAAPDAVDAAVRAQRELFGRHWPADETVRVRMGIHTGEIRESHGELVGLDVHRAARIAAAGHGGQVLVSEQTRSQVSGALPDGVGLHDLGEHQLKDLPAPEHLYQLDIEGLPTDFPPPRALSTRLDVLPTDASTFIGREAELARARQLLVGTRLLTLTGPGGTGKSRLAVRLARDVSGDFADGVAFVPLAAIREPRLVMTTVRQSLAVPEQPGRSALETVVDRLAGRQVLLVLDNFEQVLGAAADAAQLLAAAPQLTIVATSREALRIEGEQEYAVPPLSLPATGDDTDFERMSGSDAVALFVQRARSVRPDFALTRENADAVVQICARLDGLPLAIELAASRIKLLPPQALLERLGRRLDLLQSTAPDRTDRQRTLRGAIDWSYNLLSVSEQALFRRLAVFAGGFRLEDAELVVASPGAIDLDVLDGVSSLVDKSLVRQLGEQPDLRFGMLETILEFGREMLDSTGELDTVALAHAQMISTLAQEIEPKLTSGPEVLNRLDADHDNIRAALTWLATHDIEAALTLAGRLWRFWHLRGHLRDGATILTTLLKNPAAQPPTFARAKALVGHAGLVYWQSDYARARADYEEALAIAQAIGDPALEVEILYSLAYVRGIGRDFAGAERDFASARSLYVAQGNELMATWALEATGMSATLAGDHERAVALLDESLAAFERLGDAFGTRNTISVVTRALMHLGRLDDARAANVRVLDLAVVDGDLTSISQSLHDAASLAALSGELDRAARLTGAARKIVDESGAEPPPELVNRIEALPTLARELERERLQVLLAEGRVISVEDAVALAKS